MIMPGRDPHVDWRVRNLTSPFQKQVLQAYPVVQIVPTIIHLYRYHPIVGVLMNNNLLSAHELYHFNNKKLGA